MKGLGERRPSAEDRPAGKKGLHMHRKQRVSPEVQAASTDAYPTDAAAYKLLQLCGRGASSQASRRPMLGLKRACIAQDADCHVSCVQVWQAEVHGRPVAIKMVWCSWRIACAAAATCGPVE